MTKRTPSTLPSTLAAVRTLVYRHRYILSALVFFVFTSIFSILFHEWWRDEAQAWLIARDSHSLRELFNNIRYEGTPMLWHVLLYGIARMGGGIMHVQLLACAISATSVYVFLRFSPFPRTVKILFPLSYYFLFQGTIIARQYGLLILLLLLFAVVLTRRKYLLVGLIIFILPQVHSTAVFSLLTVLILTLYCLNKDKEYSKTYLKTAAAIVVVTLISVILWRVQTVMPDDSGASALLYMPKDAGDELAKSLAAFVPFFSASISNFPWIDESSWWKLPDTPTLFSYISIGLAAYILAKVMDPLWRYLQKKPDNYQGIWGSHTKKLLLLLISLLTVSLIPTTAYILGLAGVLVIAYSIYLLRGNRPLMLAYSAGIIPLAGFLMTYSTDGNRHWGIIFIYFVLCVWLTLDQNTKRSLGAPRLHRNKLQLFLVAILVMQVVASGFIMYRDISLPFSYSKMAAAEIQRHAEFQDYTWFFAGNYSTTPILVYLPFKPVEYNRTGRSRSFMVWDKQLMQDSQKTVNFGAAYYNDDYQILEKTQSLKTEYDRPVLVVTDWQLQDTQGLTKVTKLNKSEFHHEVFDGYYYIYTTY